MPPTIGEGKEDLLSSRDAEPSVIGAPNAPTGKPCRWCDEGARLIGTDHWIVQSIVPARIAIRPCKAVS